jgi:hypothetical protein
MNHQEIHLTGTPPDAAVIKKHYMTPVLKTYGEIHLATQGSSTSNGDGGPNMMNAASDRKIKENMVKVGVHPLGIGLYLFDYKTAYREQCGEGRQFGVMADEVETVMPSAVSMNTNGYKQVNYAMLGISRSIH